jgi:hypothetical protein
LARAVRPADRPRAGGARAGSGVAGPVRWKPRLGAMAGPTLIQRKTRPAATIAALAAEGRRRESPRRSQGALISMRFGSGGVSAPLGSVTVRMPLSMLAWISSALMPAGSSRLRTKAP